MKNSVDMYLYENKYKKMGKKIIAGLDEAGRGPMAGPLVVAMVILDPKKKIEGLNDSKQLTEKKREALFKQINEFAKEVQVEVISVEDVDRLNVYQASKIGMINCLKKAKSKIDFVLTDAMPLGEEFDHEAIIKGDAKSASIAAASIIAKVTRDHLMYEYAKAYPEYHFEKHKGYVTKLHREAINEFGICDIHRRSFAPVQDIIRKHNQK
ncbi:MAG: ribonuclease HII [Bacilli bacterium]|nr:ribonuclease HII [Bacilli bacterium]